jgi:type II restriction enzyme
MLVVWALGGFSAMKKHPDQLSLLEPLDPAKDTTPRKKSAADRAGRAKWNAHYDRFQDKPVEMEMLMSMAERLGDPTTMKVDPHSDLLTDEIAHALCVRMRFHHALDADALAKDKFENAIASAFRDCGYDTAKAPKGNPGHDLTIEDVRYSLKTQADSKIRDSRIDIHKFMELGKGEWSDDPEHFRALCGQVVDHLGRYERILVFRRLKHRTHEVYELVEIPKSLVLDALKLDPVISVESASAIKPATTELVDDEGTVLRLYFDGGGERKLKIKDIRKGACHVHATWTFARRAPI